MNKQYSQMIWKAIGEQKSEIELRKLCLLMLNHGVTNEEITCEFDKARLESQLSDEYEDVVLDVMDAVTGWCGPEYKLVANT